MGSVSRAQAAGSSNRSFGIVFTVFFSIVGLWPLFSGNAVRSWALGLAFACLVAALAAPAILTVPNRLWMRLGELLHRVTNPVILGALFYVVLTPFGAAMRLLGRRPLSLKLERAAPTYWIERSGAAHSLDRLKNQF